MSSGHPVHARKDLDIVKKPGANPTYPGGKVEKKSDVEVKNTVMPSGTLKIGLKIKNAQVVDLFEVKSKGNGAVLNTVPVPAGDPQIADLATVLPPAADEKWVMFTAPYVGAMGKKFDTTLRLNPSVAHANGFQVITTAATYTQFSFATDHYVFGLSLLAGQNNQNEPYAMGISAAPAKKKPAAKPAKAKAKAKKKKKK